MVKIHSQSECARSDVSRLTDRQANDAAIIIDYLGTFLSERNSGSRARSHLQVLKQGFVSAGSCFSSALGNIPFSF